MLRIPFTAHVDSGKILQVPRLYYVKLPLIVLGTKRFRDFDPDYCIIELQAFAIEYKGKILANKYFTTSLWEKYIILARQLNGNVNDSVFLTQNGVFAPKNECGLLR